MAGLPAARRQLISTIVSLFVLVAAVAGAVVIAGHNKSVAVAVPPVAEVRPVAPVAPVSPEIAHAAEDEGKAVNITIDDGPDPLWTPQVLELLRRNQVKATFCMVGPAAEAYPDLVKQVVADGHRLCDHTMSHDTGMDKKPVEYQKKEILDALRMIEKVSGVEVPYYRAPGGAFTPDSRKYAASLGMRPLGWNVDTKDFELPGASSIVETVKSQLGNGPTILFHDGGGPRDQTVEALEEILPWLKEQGYIFSFPKI